RRDSQSAGNTRDPSTGGSESEQNRFHQRTSSARRSKHLDEERKFCQHVSYREGEIYITCCCVIDRKTEPQSNNKSDTYQDRDHRQPWKAAYVRDQRDTIEPPRYGSFVDKRDEHDPRRVVNGLEKHMCCNEQITRNPRQHLAARVLGDAPKKARVFGQIWPARKR